MRLQPIARLLPRALAAAAAFFAATAFSPLPAQAPNVAYPTQSWPVAPLPADVKTDAVTAALDAAFKAKHPQWGETRAVVIIHRGQLVMERYGAGYGASTRLVSWSMAKSFTQALVGAAVMQGKVNLDAPMGNPLWAANDPRQKTTWRQWLNFTDGLAYREIGAKKPTESDAALMLFGPGRLDAVAYASSLKQIHPAGEVWNYSTASSKLIDAALARAIAPQATTPQARRAAMLAWMKASLLDPIGMQNAQPEFDAQGNFLGGSLIYATARDFAKFGLLYLRDGVWDGRRIVPAGWVDFARTPQPAPNCDIYGAGFWLSPPTGPGKPLRATILNGPRDAFSAQGHEGQLIMIVPSKDLVVVRLGLFGDQPSNWDALGDWMTDVVNAFPDRKI